MKIKLKHIAIACVSIVLGVGLFFGVRFYMTVKREVKPVVTAIPTDCMIMLRVNNAADFLNYLERQHQAITGLFDLNPNGLNAAIIKDLQSFESYINIQEFWLSAHLRNKKTEYLLLLNVDVFQQRMFQKFLDEKRNENNQIILTEISERPVFAGFSDGVFLASCDENLLNEALTQLQNPSNLLQDKALENVLNSAGKSVPANLFIQIPELAKSLKNQVKSEYSSMLETLGLFSKWIEYDLIDHADQTLLSGYAVQPKSQTFFFRFVGLQHAANLDYC